MECVGHINYHKSMILIKFLSGKTFDISHVCYKRAKYRTVWKNSYAEHEVTGKKNKKNEIK